MARVPIDWLITDTHFNHKQVVAEGGRPPGHGEQLISNCKAIIAAQDTTYHSRGCSTRFPEGRFCYAATMTTRRVAGMSGTGSTLWRTTSRSVT